ncbi:hypothetical protein KY289_008537 [Solanum tuberosum]|nr:hypothetical protein KY289_008537 [Solanum tuberosum]
MGRAGPSTIVRDDMVKNGVFLKFFLPEFDNTSTTTTAQNRVLVGLLSEGQASWISIAHLERTHEDAERNRKRARHLVPTKSALNEGRGGHSQALQLTRGNSSIREVVVHQPTIAGPVARYIMANVRRWEAQSVLLAVSWDIMLDITRGVIQLILKQDHMATVRTPVQLARTIALLMY